MIRNPYRQLERTLGVRIRKKPLLEAALTHPSYRHELGKGGEDNQRLEFLGDAVLGMMAASHLYATCPDWDEGAMTKARSQLTNRHTLGMIAAKMELGEHLRLGRGEDLSGGATRESNLGDALEAVLGAAFLDGGEKSARKIFDKWFTPELGAMSEVPVSNNPKGALQEMLQGEGLPNPSYRIIEASGPSHGMQFTAVVELWAKELGLGEGTSKRLAEAESARAALKHLQHMGLAHLRHAEPQPESPVTPEPAEYSEADSLEPDASTGAGSEELDETDS